MCPCAAQAIAGLDYLCPGEAQARKAMVLGIRIYFPWWNGVIFKGGCLHSPLHTGVLPWKVSVWVRPLQPADSPARVRRAVQIFPLSGFWVFFPFSFKLLQSVNVLEYWQFNRVLLPHRSTSIRQLLEPAVEIRSHLNTIENNQRCHWNWSFWLMHNLSVVDWPGSYWLAVSFILFTEQFI